MGCGADEESSSGPTQPPWIGDWEVVSSTAGDSTKFIMLESNNEYHLLQSDHLNRHHVENGIYFVGPGVLKLRPSAYTFQLSANMDTLWLTEPSDIITCIRHDSALQPDEWVFPLSIVEERTLNVGPEPIGDLGFYNPHVWVYSEDAAGVYQVDGFGQVAYNVPIDRVRGMAFGAGLLWLADERGYVYSLVPGDSTIYRTYSLRTNALGYRGLT
jgi:hypothetical protein